MINVTRAYIAAYAGLCNHCGHVDVQTTYKDHNTKETYTECTRCEERTPVERQAPKHAPQ